MTGCTEGPAAHQCESGELRVSHVHAPVKPCVLALLCCRAYAHLCLASGSLAHAIQHPCCARDMFARTRASVQECRERDPLLHRQVFCTVAVAGGFSMLHVADPQKFDVAIVDEAGQLAEASSLILFGVSTPG